ncbi:MAG: hypothetical protein KJ799_10670 [Bacteroidetes bacterium]|nr:hypothetical protein [Bacteroidota bacterium]MBU1679077.1 hypothetical protein [Bacteroidota bacterium]MBU2507170.1 hypothetical protein [Bacteroidota bacterium]
MSDHDIEIILDYAIPDFRDFKNGEYIYSAEVKLLKKEDVKNLIAYSDVKAHIKYLSYLGFRKSDAEENLFVKQI